MEKPLDSRATAGERIRALELKAEELAERQREMIEKLDELLALRNKGMGAFWLGTSLIGTGLIGFFWEAIKWLKG